MQARGCCLVGHPEYYKKFAFDNIPELAYEGVPAEVFLALSFDGKTPQGNVIFHEGFKADTNQSVLTLTARLTLNVPQTLNSRPVGL